MILSSFCDLLLLNDIECLIPVETDWLLEEGHQGKVSLAVRVCRLLPMTRKVPCLQSRSLLALVSVSLFSNNSYKYFLFPPFLSYLKIYLFFPDRSKSTSRPESRDNSVPRETGESLKGSPNINSATAEKFAIAIIEEFTHNNDPEVRVCYLNSFLNFLANFFCCWQELYML